MEKTFVNWIFGLICIIPHSKNVYHNVDYPGNVLHTLPQTKDHRAWYSIVASLSLSKHKKYFILIL